MFLLWTTLSTPKVCASHLADLWNEALLLWQIPSTYAPERLDLLRQLEKVKEMEGTEMNSDEMTEGVNLTSSNTE